MALALAMRATFIGVGMGGMDEAPAACVDLDRVEQQVDRRPAVRGEAVVDLARLLG